MERLNVIGSSGSGKTTVARRIAITLGVPYLELDAIHHLPDWRPIDTPELRRLVQEFTRGEQWVVDGNYSKVRDIVWDGADTVVFLDLPRWRVMSRLVPRTLRRVVFRQSLWNGNRERFSNLRSRRPEENIIVWSWTRHELQRERFVESTADPAWAHIDFVRLTSPRAVAEFLANLEPH